MDIIKKEWNNPELKNLAIENTNQEACNISATYSTPTIWHCITHNMYFTDLQEKADHEEKYNYHEIRKS